MKVWVVVANEAYVSCERVVGVFETRESAERACQEYGCETAERTDLWTDETFGYSDGSQYGTYCDAKLVEVVR
ncbi:MAG: hypothetical protein KGR26_00330 [Cyanobacteria bacterium REEB65]|nr:hypothetical protein [Cyanobacteria bacterium REEB65]